jgi:hypothetical protein
MHFPDCGRHLRDRIDFFDHETVRQKSLIDQLNDPLICRMKPDRPEMLSTYLHVSVCVVVTLINKLKATRFPITNPAVNSADSPRHGESDLWRSRPPSDPPTCLVAARRRKKDGA